MDRRIYSTSLWIAASLLAAACSKDPAGTDTAGETASSSSGGVSTVDPTTGKPGTEGTTVATTSESTGAPTTSTATSEPLTTTEPATTSGTTEASTSIGTEATTGGGVPMPVDCGGKIYACGDAIDNDMDGKIDGGDPECTSPCDDTESSFQTNLPGQNKDCNADCYWDGDSGQGNDGCSWNLQCDPSNPGADVGCAYDPNKKDCAAMQPDMCIMLCAQLAPNGCDCFGCCDVTTPNGVIEVYLGGNPDCALNNLDACNTCTKQPGCSNDCHPEKCELCFGQDQLPDGCMEAGCDNKQPCMVDQNGNSDCPEGSFCSTGCCQAIIPK
jgi:hypothetical protein